MSAWTLRYDRFEPEQEGLREALCTLGNGYFATRGAAEEAEADETHSPGVYLAGGYNRMGTEIAGRVVENEDLVNFPNWLPLRFRPEGGEWLNLRAVEILDFDQALALNEGVLRRTVRFQDHSGRITTLSSERIVHMEQPHLAALRCRLTPENWSGRLEILSALDGRVVNAGVERYRALRGDHLEVLSADAENEAPGGADPIIRLLAQTKQSQIRMAQAARTRVSGAATLRDVNRIKETGFIGLRITCDAGEGKPVTVEKVIALYTSRDRAISEPLLEASDAAAAAPDFDALLQRQRLAWKHLWRRCDLVLEMDDGGRGTSPHHDDRAQMILRLHIFHLLQTVSMNTIDLDAGVPARGLHGEAYRGHVFWDELFIFPFLNHRVPEITRALLCYRYRRLPAARAAAKAAGYRGAMFPWQSGSNGREETQQLHLNPRSGRWLPDNTHLQRHVNAGIAWSIWQYVQATGDREFLAFYGAEMLIEIARFWASIATYNDATGRYEIHGVVGPDEYNEAMPESDEPGVRNNTYTNVMAVRSIQCAIEALDRLDDERRAELSETLDLRDEEIEQWQNVSRRMTVVFHSDGVIGQFEGYESLKELDWERYREKYGSLHRLDRILEAEGDSVSRYKVSKQADALMLLYVFSMDELRHLFDHLGYRLDDETVTRTIDYYRHRTDHGSTLSRVVHSWVLARFDREHSWRLFQEALESDIADIQGGTTAEGIHLGAMAGTVDLVQRCFTGLEVRGEALCLCPQLPGELRDLKLRLRFRGDWLQLDINQREITVAADPHADGPIDIRVHSHAHRLAPGEKRRFAHAPAARRATAAS